MGRIRKEGDDRDQRKREERLGQHDLGFPRDRDEDLRFL